MNSTHEEGAQEAGAGEVLQQTMRGWTPPCHPQPGQHTHTGALGLLGGAQGALSPQVEQHIGLLVQNHLDVAGVDLMVVHSIPLPIAGLWRRTWMWSGCV